MNAYNGCDYKQTEKGYLLMAKPESDMVVDPMTGTGNWVIRRSGLSRLHLTGSPVWIWFYWRRTWVKPEHDVSIPPIY